MATSILYNHSDFDRSFHKTPARLTATNARSVRSMPAVARKRAATRLRIAAVASIMLLCFALGALVVAFAGDGQVQAAGVPSYEQVVVLPGDTLWSIAERRADKNVDIREYIVQLKKINGLASSSVQAGQVLQLP